VPVSLGSGEPFPGRDLIVFVTAGVIAVTLLQALLLPVVVRWARLPRDTSVDEERRLAATLAAEEAMAVMPEVADQLGTDADVVERTRREYEEHLGLLGAGGEDEDEPVRRHDQQYSALRLALLARKRATVVRLRDEQRIDDIVLRQFQSKLDIEEVRLSRREVVD
jgi:NhaP-type Na+/H+ or K+/H+ antiporter